MQYYQYEGVTRNGEKVFGKKLINDITSLKLELRQKGILLIKVNKKIRPQLNLKPISRWEITTFSRQMATLLMAGIPLIQAFELILRGTRNQYLQTLLQQIKNNIETGITIANSLKQCPRYFNDLYCNLIAAGELSGTLDIIFDRIATYQEKTDHLLGKIKKALYYPITVLSIALLITLLLLMFIVPQFQNLFAEFGSQLPCYTRAIIYLSACLKHHAWLIFGFCLFCPYMLQIIIRRSIIIATLFQTLLLKLPIIGNILQCAIITRFARTLATTFAAGIPLIESFAAAANATGNLVYQQSLLPLQEKIKSGNTLCYCLQQTKLFPEIVLQMIAIGEESGRLEYMLHKTADWFEFKVDQTVDGLSNLLEPILMLILGILIGGLVIAMYLPIFKLGSLI